MVNTQRLKGIIVEKGTTQQGVADSIGIDRSTFYRKMKNGGNFTIDEAQKITSELGLTNQEAVDIFFAAKVAKTLQKI